jgi:hypothetical protein
MHKLDDQVKAWEAQFRKPKKKNQEVTLDLTKDKIADKPRPEGARPTYFHFALDCRDAALIRDEAIYRGITEVDIKRWFVESLLANIRKRDIDGVG